MHPLLARQLRRVGATPLSAPTDEAWGALLRRVSAYYLECDEGRALLERSIAVSSSEMHELLRQLADASETAQARQLDLFLTAVQSLSDGLLLLAGGLVIDFANDAAARLLGVEPQALVGRRLTELLAGAPGEVDAEALEQALANARPWKSNSVTLRSASAAGGCFPASLRVSPSSGGRQRAVAVISDLTGEHEARRRQEEAHARLVREHRAMRELAHNRAFYEGRSGETLREVVRSAVETLGVDRASVWWLELSDDGRTGGDTLRLDQLFDRRTGTFAAGAVLSSSEYPAYFAALLESDYIDAEDAMTDPRTREFRLGYLEPNGIVSMLDFPVVSGGRVLGVVCLEHCSPRAWVLEDRQFAGLAANFVSVAHETAGRRAAQAEVEANRVFLDSILENLPITVHVKSAESLRYVRINRAGESLFGLDRAEIIGRSDEDLFPALQADAFAAQDQVALTSSELVDVAEERFQTAGSGHRLIHHRKVAVRDETGQPRYLLGLAEDITARKAAEEELRRARDVAEQATRAKTQFLANMSHEIRTPMHAVLGLSELLLDSGLGREPREKARGIHQAALALLRVIDDILDVSRIEAGRLELRAGPVRMDRILDDVNSTLSPLAHRKSLHYQVHRETALPEAFIGDEGRLRQILINLLGNAIKFTSRGWVSLTVFAIPDPQSSTTSNASIPWLGFRVQDTGMGIEDEELKGLFGPFAQVDSSNTRQQEGTGLGLYLVRELVQLMAGELSVRSIPGRGSTFEVRIPAPPVQAAAELHLNSGTESPPDASRRESPSTALNILVAEDNPLNQILVVSMLRSQGHNVIVTTDGHAVVEAFQAGRFDCVLMDSQMPGVDGAEATRRIRAIEATNPALGRTPIVALSASAMRGARERFIEAGMDSFLAKPFTAEGLRDVLEAARSLATADPSAPPSAPSGPRQSAATERLDRGPTPSGPAPESSAAEVFDSAAVRDLLELDSAAPGLFASLFAAYRDDFEPYLQSIANAAPDSLVEAGRAAHCLTSSSAALGGRRISQLAAETERLAYEGRVAETREMAASLRRAYSAFLGVVERSLPQRLVDIARPEAEAVGPPREAGLGPAEDRELHQDAGSQEPEHTPRS